MHAPGVMTGLNAILKHTAQSERLNVLQCKTIVHSTNTTARVGVHLAKFYCDQVSSSYIRHNSNLSLNLKLLYNPVTKVSKGTSVHV